MRDDTLTEATDLNVEQFCSMSDENGVLDVCFVSEKDQDPRWLKQGHIEYQKISLFTPDCNQ
jgi:hypothetical protein